MFNKVVLVGRLTSEVELKSTSTGTLVTTCRIAVERKFKDKDGEKITDFIAVTAWRGTAEFMSKYFHKGDMILIEGELQMHAYEKNGEKRTAYEVLAEQVRFVGSNNSKKETEPVVEFNEEITEDVPF